MVKYNTKIQLNDKRIFLADKSDKPIDDELFDRFIDSAKSFVLNDDGTSPGINYKEFIRLKDELKRFDISKDKKFGDIWEFVVNDKSRNTIKKTYQAYKPIGHTKWTLMGDNFSITYRDCEDMYDLIDGPSGEKTISVELIIKAKKESLNDIISILKPYKTSPVE